MAFEIYIPESLTFQDYVNITQCARTLADAYDRKVSTTIMPYTILKFLTANPQDKDRLRACLAPDISVDYSGVNPEWGVMPFQREDFITEWLGSQHLGVTALATQHLLGAPYFKSVTADEIVVEWQQLASHGRRVKGEDFASPACKIGEESDGRSYMLQTFVKIEGKWRIKQIRPQVIYSTGDWKAIGRPDDK